MFKLQGFLNVAIKDARASPYTITPPELTPTAVPSLMSSHAEVIL